MNEIPASVDIAFKDAVRKASHKPALIYLGEKVTYARLDEAVERLARSIYKRGVRENDKAIIFLPLRRPQRGRQGGHSLRSHQMVP